MNDDFNSPILIAQLFEAASFIQRAHAGKASCTLEDKNLLQKTLHDFMFEILGLVDEYQEPEGDSELLTGVVNLLVVIIIDSSAERNFEICDKIHYSMITLGIQYKYRKDGLCIV